MKRKWDVTVLDADSNKHTLALVLEDNGVWANMEAMAAALVPLGLRLLRAEPVMEDASA